ncbi:MAG: hypothetical protein QNI98_12630 [Woeseiaceae bacterium]|nr:hypothetical protein [Woeseiaceae bacterium]
MYADAVFHEQPDWSKRPGRRLALNFLPATLVVVAVLMALRLPVVEQSLPAAELLVRILVDDVEQVVESPFVEHVETPVAEPEPAEEEPAASPPATMEPATPTDRTDWYAEIPDAVAAYQDSLPREYSINPGMDERREEAAERFYPSRAPVKRPIWENVEKDTLGRTILVSGDCHRVLDDPNVGSRDKFLTFDQYFVFCSKSNRAPQELGFVKELRNRREGQVRYGHPAVE